MVGTQARSQLPGSHRDAVPRPRQQPPARPSPGHPHSRAEPGFGGEGSTGCPPGEMLAAIWSQPCEPLLLLDGAGFVRNANEPCAELLGTSPATLAGRHIREIVGHDRALERLRAGGSAVAAIERVARQQRLLHYVPLRVEERLVGILCRVTFREIAELEALAQEVSRQPPRRQANLMAADAGVGARYSFNIIIGRSPTIQATKALAMRAATSHANILIVGETGTGKELLAHAVHLASPRARGPFVKLNCASIPADLLEAELFGYDEGAFTGARRQGKPGKFELANHGTLFLDEIGDMPLHMQAKILRVIQEREVDRLGSTRPRLVDVRIVAATNRNLESMVRAAGFREDLYFRLNVISIQVPPLRQRAEDVPDLVRHFLAAGADSFGRPCPKVAGEAMDSLLRYHWPGNVRELQNVAERLVCMVDREVIDASDLPPEIRAASTPSRLGARVGETRAARAEPSGQQGGGATGSAGAADLDAAVAKAEKEQIVRALDEAGGNRSRAAENLGIHRSTLYLKLRRHGLH